MLLSEMGVSPTFIVGNLLRYDAESTEAYIDEMPLRIERMRLAVDRLSGHAIAVDLSAVIPEILTPELHDAAKRSDWEASKRINEAIAYVLTLLDKQKENSNG